MVSSVLALFAYLGVVYVPAALCIGLMWFTAASIFRKTRGTAWPDATKRSAREAVRVTLVTLAALLALGLVLLLGGV